MKTFECIAKSGNTGKQIVIMVRAIDSSKARMDALNQARQQFGSGLVRLPLLVLKSVNEV